MLHLKKHFNAKKYLRNEFAVYSYKIQKKTDSFFFTLIHIAALYTKTLNKASLMLELKKLKFFCIPIIQLT